MVRNKLTDLTNTLFAQLETADLTKSGIGLTKLSNKIREVENNG